MSQFASKTDVSSDKSRTEIEKTLRRYGADSFIYATSRTHATVGFEMQNRRIMFHLPMPDPSDKAFTHTPTGKKRVPNQVEKAYEQAIRQKWRALALVIKAKLEAVESGIAEFEEEFLANIVLPDGQTVGKHLLPQVETAYQTGNMPPLLPKM